jgi:serine protease
VALKAATDQLNQTMGAGVLHTSPYSGFKVLRIPKGKTVAEMVDIYSQQPSVEYVEPNYIYHIAWSPDDPIYPWQWHFDQINLEAAWDLDTASPNYGGDPSIVVAVVDSGVAYETDGGFVQAPDLAGTNFTTGWDFVNNDAHPNDDRNHGTHVCGTIAQGTNDSEGVAGIAFNTTIMPIKVFNSAGNGTAAQTADGFYYAADNGAHIINYSGGGPHSTTMENAVAYARNAGVLLVAAMGNDGDTTMSYPAAYDDYAIGVGATRYDQTRSYYSSYGSHNDIAAPGGDVTIDQNGDTYADGVLQQTFTSGNVADFQYYFFQGTSMATPHVSGVAALIMAEHPTWSAAQVRHALLSTVTDKGPAGKDDEYGWGLLDAPASVGSSLSAFTSYSDAAHTITSDNFSGYGAKDTVYMFSTSLLPSQHYSVAYYDGSNTRRATENITSGASGNLSSQHIFAPGTDAEGTWHVIISEQAHTPPPSYSANWTYSITEDTFVLQFTTPPTMEPIAEAEGEYYNTAPILSNFGFDDDEALDDGWYQMDSYNGTWTVLFTNSGNTSWDDDDWPIPGFVALSQDSHTIYFMASDNASNVEGESGEWSWQFYKDTLPPTGPTSVSSTSHTTSVWSSDNTVDITWTDATDNLSGLDGYSILWDTSANSTPGASKDIDEGVQTTTSPALADGSSHYFHIRAVDNAGNWKTPVHLGPFFIETVPPTDPTSVNSTSHITGVWSSDNTVAVNWTDATDNLSGLDGYSILWDTSANTTPSANKTIDEGIGNVTSSELADGNSHYFHISSVDNAGNWQSTVHLGPFYIDTTPPTDPTSVNSTSHTTGVWSSDNTVAVNWTDATDNLSGLDGYSILWDTSANTTPSAPLLPHKQRG